MLSKQSEHIFWNKAVTQIPVVHSAPITESIVFRSILDTEYFGNRRSQNTNILVIQKVLTTNIKLNTLHMAKPPIDF